MRTSISLSIALALLVQATTTFAAVTTIRTGQVAGVPGSCNGSDDSFRFYAPNPNCGQPILPTPFTAADFSAACAGPQAVVIQPYVVWSQSLACDPEARWISTATSPGSCFGEPTSALYCARFQGVCSIADSVRVCWSVDDFLGDPPSFPGPNPDGIYINGTSLGAAFSGPGSNPTYTAVATNVPLINGVNSLEVYQRDAGCGLGGLILNAKIYTSCGTVETESMKWGRVKTLFR